VLNPEKVDTLIKSVSNNDDFDALLVAKGCLKIDETFGKSTVLSPKKS
jgi:hypothetical protein